jgi:hypothetical protein
MRENDFSRMIVFSLQYRRHRVKVGQKEQGATMSTSSTSAPDHSHDERREQPKSVTIIVNARSKSVPRGDLSFESVVALAFPDPPSNDITVFTVDYRKGEGNRPSGTLSAGQSVRVKEGMIFNVVASDKS